MALVGISTGYSGWWILRGSNFQYKMNKFLKIAIPTVLVIIIVLVIAIYFYNFFGKPISQDPAEWGQLWDYIWGLLNPIIWIANLILLGWITIHVVHIDKRPHIDIRLTVEYWTDGQIIDINIIMKNCWSGSAIVKSILIQWNNQQLTNFQPIIKSFPKWWVTSTYSLDQGWSLYPWEDELLFRIGKSSDTEFMSKVINILKKYTITIEYQNIYEAEKHKISRDLQQSFNSLEL